MTLCADCCYKEKAYCQQFRMPCHDIIGCEQGIKKPASKPERVLSDWEAAWAEWARNEVSNHS